MGTQEKIISKSFYLEFIILFAKLRASLKHSYRPYLLEIELKACWVEGGVKITGSYGEDRRVGWNCLFVKVPCKTSFSIFKDREELVIANNSVNFKYQCKE